MDPEFWLAIAAFFGSVGLVTTVALIRYKFKRNGAGTLTTAPSDCIEGEACDDKMRSAEKLVDSKLETVSVQLEGQGREIGEIKEDIKGIKTTTGEIHLMVTAMEERRRA